mgnify:CR=1 FL=1
MPVHRTAPPRLRHATLLLARCGLRAAPLTKSVHTYTTRWREAGMDWLIDGVLVHKVRGAPGVKDEPQHVVQGRQTQAMLDATSWKTVFFGAGWADASSSSGTASFDTRIAEWEGGGGESERGHQQEEQKGGAG